MEDSNRDRLKGKLFQGKVVIVYLINPHEAFSGGIAISNPKIEELHGRVFLIGKVPFSADDWTSGLATGVAFDQVAHFLEFADENEFIEKASYLTDGGSLKTVQ